MPRGPERAGEPHLSVAAVARMLGIAPATLRTWDRRYGIGPSAHAAARGIAGARLIEYEGEPHGLNVTAKDRLARDLLDFLSA